MLKPFVFLALLLLTICFSCNQAGTDHLLPTELVELSSEKEQSSARKAWIESMHRAAPDVNWREVEHHTAMEKHQRRSALRSTVNARADWEDVIPEKYRGKWAERGSKNQAGSVFDTEFDPESEALWLISAGGTLFKGSLNGNDWQPVNEDLRFSTGMLKRLPTSEGHHLVALINNQPHYSPDGGQTWQPSLGFLELRVGRKAAVFLNDADQSIYVLSRSAAGFHRLMRSVDQGVSYTEVASIHETNRPFIFSPTHSDAVYVLEAGPSGNVISKVLGDGSLEEISQSNAMRYSRLNMSGYLENDNLHLVTYDDDDNVLASEDGGLTWETRGRLPVTPWAVGMYQSPSSPNVLMIGDIECYVSRNGGADWNKVHDWWEYYDDVNGKLHADMMHFKEFEDKNGDPFLLISNHGGLNISRTNLVLVDNLSLSELNVAQYYDVISSPLLPDWIFAGSQDQGLQRGQGVIGENINMEQVVSGDYGHMVFGEDQTSLWTVYPFGSISFYERADQDGYAMASYEIDSNDEFIWINPTSSIKQDGVNGIYVAGGNMNGGDGSYIIKLVYNSNGYLDVEQIDYNFTEFTDNGLISAIEVSPINSDIIYTATDNGRFFYSYDAGESWEQNINFIPDGHYLYGQNVLASQLDEDKVWLAGSGYSNPAVYYSENGGETFTPMAEGLPSTLVFELATNEEETFLVAATESGPYLYIFEDERWYDISGISAPNQTYWSVEYLEDEKIARFGTYGRGVWDVELEDLSVVTVNETWTERELFIFPNPVYDELKISTSLNNGDNVRISIVDTQGRTLYQDNMQLNDGNDLHVLNLSDLSSGYYTLNISGKSRSASRKFIKL